MTLKAAVVGVGMMGRNHARVYSEMPEVVLVGVADTDQATAKAVADQYGGKAYTDFERMLDEQRPDVLSIAVPTDEHYHVAMQAIARKIPILIEKPIAHSLDEARTLIDAAAKANLPLTVGHIERYNPAVIALKQRLEAGELGRIFQIDARRQSPFPARVKDVGVVIDLAVHDVDIIRYLSNAEVARVFAETESRIQSIYEDLMVALLRMRDGTIGSLTINWLTPTKIRELFVTGERGMFRVDYLLQDLYFFENSNATGSEWDALKILRGVSEGPMVRYSIRKREPLRAELEAFLAAVRGEAPVLVSGYDGLVALGIAQAIVRSGKEHRIVELGEVG